MKKIVLSIVFFIFLGMMTISFFIVSYAKIDKKNTIKEIKYLKDEIKKSKDENNNYEEEISKQKDNSKEKIEELDILIKEKEKLEQAL